MSTSVCQSQFDTWLAEPRNIGFKPSQPTPKLSPSSTCFPVSDNSHIHQQNTPHKTEDLGGWSFLQDLTKNNSAQTSEEEKVYVHPLVKKSSSVLSLKSLEMCTESLGSETGSTISDDELISSSFVVSDMEKSPVRILLPAACYNTTVLKERSTTMTTATSSSSFPPPITTIRGGSSGKFQVESQRQDGRLVMKAVCVGTNKSCLKAERINGRLMLRFLDNSNELDLDEGDELCDVNDYEANDNDEDKDMDMDVDNDDQLDNYGFEVKMSNSIRRRRCNEEQASRRCKDLQNWKPFLVATS